MGRYNPVSCMWSSRWQLKAVGLNRTINNMVTLTIIQRKHLLGKDNKTLNMQGGSSWDSVLPLFSNTDSYALLAVSPTVILQGTMIAVFCSLLEGM